MLKRVKILALGAALLFGTGIASAQEAFEAEIDRHEIDIARPHPEPAAVESVLVFSHRGVGWKRVHCVAWDKRGQVVGRLRTDIPPQGLRYVLASDFGRPFLGTARCNTNGRVVGSAFLLAPGLTNLPVETGSVDHTVRIRFDLLAYRP